MNEERILFWFFVAAARGCSSRKFGYFLLSDQPRVPAWMQVFAAADSLYLVFEDIAPQARLKNSNLSSLVAVLGFLLGLIGKLLEG